MLRTLAQSRWTTKQRPTGNNSLGSADILRIRRFANIVGLQADYVSILETSTNLPYNSVAIDLVVNALEKPLC